jgi:alpha-ketoglutaric semialdehyde dehydrogenase
VIKSYSPHAPDDLVTEAPETSAEDVAKAFAHARAAQAAWWRGPAATRAQVLSDAADTIAAAAEELTGLTVREVGKPVGEARGEMARAVAILRYYAQQVYDPVGAVHEPSAGGLLYSRRRPLGVAGLITPWNFPIAIPIWKAAPALAFGNAVVLKPSPEATATALRLAALLAEVLPAGLFSVLPGDGETGRAIVAEADVVSFTGSTVVGREVALAAAARGVRVQAEMGGQNPAVVLPDADVEETAKQIAAAAMGFAGQKCTATKRVIVVGDAALLRDALVAAVEALGFGDPTRAATAVGPVINETARNKVLAAAGSATAAGARLLTGGLRGPQGEATRAGLAGGAAADGPGWYMRPILFENVPADHPLSCDEVFGPIATLRAVRTLQEALAMANDVPQGLVAGVYTRDLTAALAASDALDAGLVKVNAPTTGVDFYLPFGGEKASSVGGREQGKAAQDFFTSIHTVTVAPSPGPLPFSGEGA